MLNCAVGMNNKNMPGSQEGASCCIPLCILFFASAFLKPSGSSCRTSKFQAQGTHGRIAEVVRWTRAELGGCWSEFVFDMGVGLHVQGSSSGLRLQVARSRLSLFEVRDGRHGGPAW